MIDVVDIGTVSYQVGMAEQLSEREKVLSGKSRGKIFILQHSPSVITIGKRGSSTSLLFPEDEISSRGYEIFRINRAGDVTVHEKGQVVLYFVLPVQSKNTREFIHSIISPLQLFLYKNYGLRVKFDNKFPGLWIEKRKICSMGFDLTGGVSMHGLALNVSNTLEGFSLISPCGLDNVQMTSLSREHGEETDVNECVLLLKKFIEKTAKYHSGFSALPQEQGPALDGPSSGNKPTNTF